MVDAANPDTAGRTGTGAFRWINTPRAIIALVAVLLATGGSVAYYAHRAHLRQQIQLTLSAIAEQKATRLSAWLAERQGNAYSVSQDVLLGRSVAGWLAAGAAPGAPALEIEARLAALLTAYGYDGVVLFDAQGNQRLAIGPSTAIGPADRAHAIDAARSGQIVTSDIHFADTRDGEIVLDYFAPLAVIEGVELKNVAVVMLRTLPGTFIEFVLRTWPVASPSAESLLVRREGEEVVFLNDVRGRPGTALKLRLPANRSDLPAAMAVRGIEGPFEGADYGGRPVVAALRTVPIADWSLVVKMDVAEAYAPMRATAFAIFATALFVLALAAWAVSAWWRSASAHRALHEARLALERQALVKHFDYLSKYANDMIVLIDDKFRIVEVNDRAVELFGRPREELIGAPGSILRAPGHEQRGDEVLRRLASSDSVLYETLACRKDGSTFPVEVSLQRIEVEGKTLYQGIARDITERKSAEQSLHESEAKFRDLVENTADWIWEVDEHGVYRYSSPQVESLLGYRPDEVIGRTPFDLMPPDEAKRTREIFAAVMGARKPLLHLENRNLAKDGRTVSLETSCTPIFDAAGTFRGYRGIDRDISERKWAELDRIDRLRRVQAQIEAIGVVSLSDALLSGKINTFAREITEIAAQVTGVARANVWLFNDNETELRCIDLYETAAKSHSAGAVLTESQYANEFAALKHAPYVDADDPLTDARTAGYVDGYVKPLGISSMLDAVVRVPGKHLGLLCLEHVGRPHRWERDEVVFACQLADRIALALITRARRDAQETLAISEARFRTLAEVSPDVISYADKNGKTLYTNKRWTEMTGLTDADSLGAGWVRALHPDDRDRVVAAWHHTVTTAAPFDEEYRLLDAKGDARWISCRALAEKDANGDVTGFVSTATDITERQRERQALERSERHFRKLMEGSSDAFFVIDAAGTVIYRSESAERMTGYATSEILGKPITSYLDPDSLPPARSALANTLRRPGKPVRTEVRLVRGDGSLIDLEVVGRNLIHDPDVGGIVVTVRDIGERKKAEETQRQSSLKLNAILTQTVQAIAVSMERRDPLTAGHQQRVAQLAEAIALEMGVAKDRADGIRFAASIHDVGMGAVPTEIVNRPGPLDPHEFELVKSHAEAGFDIVKDIAFPWPVAQTILQHHERLDGSGYPDGLKGEAILPEARIIAVADVVGAICSHRPYRPALGVDDALAEITQGRGRLYDPGAVDACVRLFREKGFAFAREANVARPAAGERAPLAADKVA